MTTVLVTGVGGACGIGAVTTLAEHSTYRIVGVDADPTAAGLHLADVGTTVPTADEETWPAAMAEVVTQHDVDVVVPTVDEELAVRPALERALPDDVPVVAPSTEVIDLSLDKYRTVRRLADAGHPVPRTWLATEVERVPDDAFPVVVKPRRGRGSRGVRTVVDADELARDVAEAERDPSELLCQERIEGTEYTTSVVATSGGELLAVVPKEAIRKDGSTALGATRSAPAVAASCRDIFETLDPAGPINVQQLLDADGRPRTIEINPRFSSTSCLTAAAGVDEFDLLIRDALGESVDPSPEYEADRYIVRYDAHLFADAEDLSQVR